MSTKVYAARVPHYVTPHGNFPFGRLVCEGHPVLDRRPEYWTPVGTAADELAARIRALGELATLERYGSELRPLAASGSADEAPAHQPVRRSPGRPGWSTDEFRRRYRAALEAALPSTKLDDIAGGFEALDGTRGVEPDHLRRLIREHGGPT
jgi:hypothetical protein